MTKQLLINEALDIVQKEAFSALSFQMLADRVGIKKASVYYHFSSKEKLALGVIEDANTKLGKYFTSIALQKPDKQLGSYIKLGSPKLQKLLLPLGPKIMDLLSTLKQKDGKIG